MKPSCKVESYKVSLIKNKEANKTIKYCEGLYFKKVKKRINK